ncbi:MAG: hypothetical protein ACRDD1_10440, partial [Planctomycetia bacterium]
GFGDASRRGGMTAFSSRTRTLDFGEVGRDRSARAATAAAVETSNRSATAMSALAVDAYLASSVLAD